MRLRAASGDLAGPSASASGPPLPMEPGTRLALGTRLGSPACVVSPAAGSVSACAARHPSSAGDVHDDGAACCVDCTRVELRVFPLRRNQSDSSESKIGSR